MNQTDTAPLWDTIIRLRGENGCPWDRKQTAKTLVKYIRNETEELIEAIEKSDVENICEELGDVLYLICMVTAINKEEKNFNFSQVVQGITDKLVRRHPHVFAGKEYKDEADLARQWEAIKAEEKRAKKK